MSSWSLQARLSPVARFLDDPMASMRQAWDYLSSLIATNAAMLSGTALMMAIAGVLARTALVRWQQARLIPYARVIDILPPPSVDIAGAEALWTHLLGLLRPRWLRPITGVPHVTWEYVFTETGVRIRLWIPGVIPPGLVERAIEGSWPGAATRTAHAADQPSRITRPCCGRSAPARPPRPLSAALGFRHRPAPRTAGRRRITHRL